MSIFIKQCFYSAFVAINLVIHYSTSFYKDTKISKFTAMIISEKYLIIEKQIVYLSNFD